MLKLWFEAIVCSFKSLSQSQYQLSCDSVLRSAGHEVSSRHCNQAADYLPYCWTCSLLQKSNSKEKIDIGISSLNLYTSSHWLSFHINNDLAKSQCSPDTNQDGIVEEREWKKYWKSLLRRRHILKKVRKPRYEEKYIIISRIVE